MFEIRIYDKSIDKYTFFNNVGGFFVVLSILKSEVISKWFSHGWLVKLGAL